MFPLSLSLPAPRAWAGDLEGPSKHGTYRQPGHPAAIAPTWEIGWLLSIREVLIDLVIAEQQVDGGALEGDNPRAPSSFCVRR